MHAMAAALALAFARYPVVRPPLARPRRAFVLASSLGTSGLAEQPRRRILALEGNIGAGKSTLLARLKNAGLETIEEPITLWQGAGSENLLDLFYSDPQRWAFTFQSFAFLSRAKAAVAALRAAPDGAAPAVLERSIASDRQIFAVNCRETGLFSDSEWEVYDSFHSWLTAEFDLLRLDGAVYLRTTPATCLARMRRRGRAEEAGMALPYLEQLHARHEEWLLPSGLPLPQGGALGAGPQHSLASDGTPVLVVDWDADCEDGGPDQAAVVEAIAQFVRGSGLAKV